MIFYKGEDAISSYRPPMTLTQLGSLMPDITRQLIQFCEILGMN